MADAPRETVDGARAHEHQPIRVIREEHALISSLLRLMALALHTSQHQHTPPDFGLMRKMLFYLDEFIEHKHHHKESEWLFPKLRARTPLARDILDHLDGDHASGERNIRVLERALLAFEILGESRRPAFEQALERYTEFYVSHMQLEERKILPLAEKMLTPADWDDMSSAFGDHEPDGLRLELYAQILRSMPEPVQRGRPRNRNPPAQPTPGQPGEHKP